MKSKAFELFRALFQGSADLREVRRWIGPRCPCVGAENDVRAECAGCAEKVCQGFPGQSDGPGLVPLPFLDAESAFLLVQIPPPNGGALADRSAAQADLARRFNVNRSTISRFSNPQLRLRC